MLSIGIVGLPNVGKSTLFNAVTKSSALAANYPFATIEPNVGIVPIPDQRLQKLSLIYPGAKIVPATIRFVDIAGLVAGASQGEGMGNQFLSHIRTTAAIVEVVRLFKDDQVTRVVGSSDPKTDISIINTELMLADLATIDRRLARLDKEAKSNPKLKPVLKIYDQAKALLNDGKMLHGNLDSDALAVLADLQLISAKPIIYVFNMDEQELSDKNLRSELGQLLHPAKTVFVSAKIESELNSLDDDDAIEFRQSYGLHLSGLESLVTAAYDGLGLQSFLTAGDKEIRAWTIPKGATAPQAAGVIHTDFQRGFIAAEIVSYSDLIDLGSIAACRAAGKVRTEGKTYIIQPDDIVEFRFNV